MAVLAAILTTIAAGIPVVLAIDRRSRGPELLGLSFLYGAVVVYFGLFLLSIAGVAWSLMSASVVILVIATVLFFTRGRGEVTGTAVRPHVVDLATAVAVAGFTVYATLARVWEWDFWAIWGLKARIFLGSGGIDWTWLERPANEFAHPDYPLLLPLNYAFAGLVAGGWDDRWMGLYTVAFGVALLCVIRGVIAREARPLIAAAITFASTAFALSAFVGLAEAPMIAYGSAAILYLRLALRDGGTAWTHGALLLGAAALSKNEGQALLVAVAVAIVIHARTRGLLRLWPALALVAPWLIVKAMHVLPNDLAQGSAMERAMTRLGDPIGFISLLIEHLADGRMWLLIAIGAIVAMRPLARERFVLIAVALQMCSYAAAYLVTPHELEWHILTSWSRLTRQIGVPILVIVCLALASIYTATRDPNDIPEVS